MVRRVTHHSTGLREKPHRPVNSDVRAQVIMSRDRLIRTFDLAYECLRRKINGGRIRVDNEASLQLQFASILKSVGELFEVERDEFFSLELEKAISLKGGAFGKSGTNKAKIDVFFSFTNSSTGESVSCAVEMKFFKKKNYREPNNRYDVFADIKNLESYGTYADYCFLLIATDHNHYVSQQSYSPDTADFDFRHGRTYVSGTPAIYRTRNPYGSPIVLSRSYSFSWDTTAGGLHFLKLPVEPTL